MTTPDTPLPKSETPLRQRIHDIAVNLACKDHMGAPHYEAFEKALTDFVTELAPVCPCGRAMTETHPGTWICWECDATTGEKIAQLERENARLKQRVAELEAARDAHWAKHDSGCK